jgi:hypothetical protein
MKGLQAAACVGIATAVMVLVGVPGMAFLWAPKPIGDGEWHFVADLASAPDNGVPRVVGVFAEDQGGWNVREGRVVGRVFLIREPGAAAQRAYRIHCPCGTAIHWNAEKNVFESACWDLQFDLHGKTLRERDRDFSGDMIGVAVKVERERVIICWPLGSN